MIPLGTFLAVTVMTFAGTLALAWVISLAFVFVWDYLSGEDC